MGQQQSTTPSPSPGTATPPADTALLLTDCARFGKGQACPAGYKRTAVCTCQINPAKPTPPPEPTGSAPGTAPESTGGGGGTGTGGGGTDGESTQPPRPAWHQTMDDHVAKHHAEAFTVPGIGVMSMRELLFIMAMAFVFFQLLMNKKKIVKVVKTVLKR